MGLRADRPPMAPEVGRHRRRGTQEAAGRRTGASPRRGDDPCAHHQRANHKDMAVDGTDGAGRGGLYSYDWLENLAGLGIHSVDRIVPEFQALKEGDVFPLDAPSGTGPTVAELVPERAIVLHFLDPQAGRSVLSWAYILDPVDEGTTRLIFRFKLDVDPRPLWDLIYALLIEIPHFVMERKMMLGIKERVQHSPNL
jgi:hypothetical protein